jgi:hypothetical protein
MTWKLTPHKQQPFDALATPAPLTMASALALRLLVPAVADIDTNVTVADIAKGTWIGEGGAPARNA